MQVTEKVIDELIEQTDASPTSIDQFWVQIESQAPALSTYVTSIDQSILTDDEYSQLLYITMIIVKCYLTDHDAITEVESTDDLSAIEDQNWVKLEARKGEFRSRIDIFFEGYKEEDLLAFVEDMLVEDEEDVFTPIGREVLFVKSKTLIDWLW